MLLCISGSLRAASVNTKLLHEAARSFGGDHAFADLRLPLYDGDLENAEGIPEAVQKLANDIQSLSGVLKNALDWVSRVKSSPWRDKPVAIMSAAAGRAGGARSNYALRLAMSPFRPRLLTGPEVLVAGAASQFDTEGRLSSERYEMVLTELMGSLREEANR